jgi:hypothetical protein
MNLGIFSSIFGSSPCCSLMYTQYIPVAHVHIVHSCSFLCTQYSTEAMSVQDYCWYHVPTIAGYMTTLWWYYYMYYLVLVAIVGHCHVHHPYQGMYCYYSYHQ